MCCYTKVVTRRWFRKFHVRRLVLGFGLCVWYSLDVVAVEHNKVQGTGDKGRWGCATGNTVPHCRPMNP
jgi:hypothetical protein